MRRENLNTLNMPPHENNFEITDKSLSKISLRRRCGKAKFLSFLRLDGNKSFVSQEVSVNHGE